VVTDVGGIADGVHDAVGMVGGDGFDHLACEGDLSGVAWPPQPGQHRQAHRSGQER
jgi:hypothetical protein